MLGKFIAGDFVAIDGEMRQFLASIENTGHSKKIQYGCVVTQELNLIIKLWMSKPSGQNKNWRISPSIATKSPAMNFPSMG
jgi:hypothetical protein